MEFFTTLLSASLMLYITLNLYRSHVHELRTGDPGPGYTKACFVIFTAGPALVWFSYIEWVMVVIMQVAAFMLIAAVVIYVLPLRRHLSRPHPLDQRRARFETR